MSDAKLANQQTDDSTGPEASRSSQWPEEGKPRSRPVKPGHLEVGEFTSDRIGAGSPFGHSNFPLPPRSIYYEPSEPVEERILEDERD